MQPPKVIDAHKTLKEKIKANKLISYTDHLIACGPSGFSDLRLTELDKKLTKESKYYLTMTLNSEPVVLCHPNFINLRQQIDELMIKSNYFGGYDAKNNRVLLHYKGDGDFRIGNKKGGEEFITSFEICDFKTLARRINYKAFINCLPNTEKHRALQILIAELGLSFGFNVKLAINDSTSILSNENFLASSGKILELKDLNLSHIYEINSLKDIDRIDVVWCDPITQNIVVAFEVERSRKYDSLLRRFSTIVSNLPYNPYLICVGSDYKGFKSCARRDMSSYWFRNSNLRYLFVDDLYLILQANKKFNSAISITDFLQSKALYPIYDIII